MNSPKILRNITMKRKQVAVSMKYSIVESRPTLGVRVQFTYCNMVILTVLYLLKFDSGHHRRLYSTM